MKILLEKICSQNTWHVAVFIMGMRVCEPEIFEFDKKMKIEKRTFLDGLMSWQKCRLHWTQEIGNVRFCVRWINVPAITPNPIDKGM